MLINCGPRDCDCAQKTEATFVDYSRTLENNQFKICLSADSSAMKDGVFYYTNPTVYEILDCLNKRQVKILNPALNETYRSILYVDNEALFVNHHKSRSFDKRHCGSRADAQCDFWIRYKETYYKNGNVDTVHEIHYPRLTNEMLQTYLRNFEASLTKVKKDNTFAENETSMKGFDYYGHAEDLLLCALNGNRVCEEKFKDYGALTENVIGKKVYSRYHDVFDAQVDKEFFAKGMQVLEEVKAYKRKYFIADDKPLL